MATPIRMPMPGQMTEECTVLQWFKAEGDTIAKEQDLLEVETDKAVVEIPAPYSGTVKRLIAETGDIVPVGGALAERSTERGRDTGAS